MRGEKWKLWQLSRILVIVLFVVTSEKKKEKTLSLAELKTNAAFDLFGITFNEGHLSLTTCGRQFLTEQTTNSTTLDKNHNSVLQPWSWAFGRDLSRPWFLFQRHERYWINKCTTFPWQFFLWTHLGLWCWWCQVACTVLSRLYRLVMQLQHSLIFSSATDQWLVWLETGSPWWLAEINRPRLRSLPQPPPLAVFKYSF